MLSEGRRLKTKRLQLRRGRPKFRNTDSRNPWETNLPVSRLSLIICGSAGALPSQARVCLSSLHLRQSSSSADHIRKTCLICYAFHNCTLVYVREKLHLRKGVFKLSKDRICRGSPSKRFGFFIVFGEVASMAAWNCRTEEKLPRRMTSVVIRAKKRSTMLNQELPVGVK